MMRPYCGVVALRRLKVACTEHRRRLRKDCYYGYCYSEDCETVLVVLVVLVRGKRSSKR
jgi:hypothetical protein